MYLECPLFTLWGMSPFEDNWSTCFNKVNSSVRAVCLDNHLISDSESLQQIVSVRETNWWILTLGSVSHTQNELRAHSPLLLAHDQATFAQIFHCSKDAKIKMKNGQH